jgi:hypothetical protein
MDHALTFVFNLVKALQPGIRNRFNLPGYLNGVLSQLGVSLTEINHTFIYGKPKVDYKVPLTLNRAELVFRKGLKKVQNAV